MLKKSKIGFFISFAYFFICCIFLFILFVLEDSYGMWFIFHILGFPWALLSMWLPTNQWQLPQYIDYFFALSPLLINTILLYFLGIFIFGKRGRTKENY